jgi:hypothetical protein
MKILVDPDGLKIGYQSVLVIPRMWLFEHQEFTCRLRKLMMVSDVIIMGGLMVPRTARDKSNTASLLRPK